MKKFLACLLIIMLVFTGCSMQKVKDEVKEEVSDMKHDFKEAKEDVKNVMEGKPDDGSLIGENKAKEIALDKAGLTSEGIIFDRIELETENGKWIYEIDFKSGTSEYEADIDALTGEIISWSVDKD